MTQTAEQAAPVWDDEAVGKVAKAVFDEIVGILSDAPMMVHVAVGEMLIASVASHLADNGNGKIAHDMLGGLIVSATEMQAAIVAGAGS